MTPILGVGASGGAKPGTPTIGTATGGDASATVAFTAPTYTGKGGTVTYRATSSPGSITGTSTTSPITVSGLTNGTAYTFTVRAETSYGVNSDSSAASNSVTPAVPVYSLSATFNASGNFTVPSGKTKLAVYVVSSAVGGNAGQSASWSPTNEQISAGVGRAGGSGGGAVGFKEYTTNAGTNFAVTIGTTSSFGNLASASTSSQNSNVSGFVTRAAATGGNGGNAGQTNINSGPSNGGSGNAGGAGGNITVSDANVPALAIAGGGGGGGGGCAIDYNNQSGNATGGSGGAGGSGGGGAGGNAGNAAISFSPGDDGYVGTTNVSNGGTSGSAIAGGGGGGAGGSGARGGVGGVSTRSGGAASNGGTGRVLVYVK